MSLPVHFSIKTRSQSRSESLEDLSENERDQLAQEPTLGDLSRVDEEVEGSDSTDISERDISIGVGSEAGAARDEVRVRLSNMTEARAPMISPNKFSGHPSGDNVEEYITRFERVARANGWDDARKVVLIPCYLEGAALKWFENLEQSLGQVMSWAQVKSGMKEAFQTVAWDEQLEYKLRMRMQEENEPIESYLQDVTNLCTKVDPAMTERCKIKHVLRGLRPSLLEKVMIMENDTLEHLRENIRKVQTARFMAGQRIDHLLGDVTTGTTTTAAVGTPSWQGTTSKLENQLEALTSEFSKLNLRLVEQSRSGAGPSRDVGEERKNQPSHDGRYHPGRGSGSRGFDRGRRGGGRTSDGRVICYKCNRVGHYAVNCRTINQDQGNEDEGR